MSTRSENAAAWLQTLGPFLPTVKDGDDFQTVTSEPVGDHVWCAWDDEFSRTGNSTRTAQIRKFGETLDRVEECAGDSIGGLGILARDVRSKVRQVLDSSRRPDDDHTRGAFRSRFRPQERSQFATSLCGTPRPSSSPLMPA